MEFNSKLLENKVVVITGAGRGIGKAISERFLFEGAIVYGIDLLEGSMNELAKHTQFHPFCLDITDQKAIRDFFVCLQREQGHLDVLVNNAGIMKDAYLPMISDEVIQRTFEVNVFAIIHLMKYAVKLMRKHKAGSIINAASIMGVGGNSGQIVYSATKGAVIAMTKSAAKELAAENIRVNAVAPGVVETDMIKSVPDDQLQTLLSKIGLRRLATASDIADVYLFLASDLSRYVSGQIIGVDGMMIN